MPRGDGTGPPGAGSRGRAGGRRMGRGRAQGRRMCQARRTGSGNRPAEPSSLPRATVPTLAGQQLDTRGPREAARRAGHPPPVASVNEAACTLCGACQAVCPTEAITLGETAVTVNAAACCGCGACMEVCPNGAISLE